ELDKILGDKMLNGWIGMGPGRGRLKVELGHPFPEVMEDSFYEDTPDHRILVVAQYMKENNPDRRVILITKDVNLRIKAKALSIEAQDYMNDKVRDESIVSLSKGVVRMNRVTPQTMAKLYQTADGLSAKDIRLKGAHNNQYYILKNKDGSALARYEAAKKRLVPVPNHRAYGITPRNQEQNFALDALLNPAVSLVSLTGIAGTGKTLLALAAALAQEDDYDQILLSRPVIPLKNQEMGFLPGDIKEKLAPYMLPLMDNLSVIKGSVKENSRDHLRIEEMLKTEKLLISPLAYIRGRSLSKVFFIVDESQNLTPHEVKTIITRAGEGSKLVFTGDIHQIDQPYLDMHSNGLTYLTDKMLGQDLFAHVNLVKGERSRLAEVAGNIL
ncbi:MAG TPA: PhoH family protein, partial [Bacteroidales bacterium]|nr:PhoH family protein [Bacteroidales bacterium]